MITNMGTSNFFVAGGTLHPNSASYVKRAADEELYNLALTGNFCYVLTARQMGKSSLMVRTSRRLRAAGAATVVIDLTGIGTVTVDEWYVNLLTELQIGLNLSVDPEEWWQQHAALGPVKRFTNFLHQVMLQQVQQPIAIFIDEIDTTLNLDFSDDFFAATRFIYNARSRDDTWSRLTFVLLGVATPADLIKDRGRTPFNIGQRIQLSRFSREDAQVLQEGLQETCPGGADRIFNRIFYWTNGHPYLTQTLCLIVAESGDENWPNARVDNLVKQLFLAEEARKETNLKFVQDSVSGSPQKRQLLKLYKQIFQGKRVVEDERSTDQNRLKLFGLIEADKGELTVSNEIYRRVFNLNWISNNTPVDWTRRLAFVSTVLVLVLVASFGLSIYWQGQQTNEVQAQTFIKNFRDVPSADVRLTSMAGLFGLPGYQRQPARLFHQELGPEEQLALFDLANPQALGDKLTTVVQGLYMGLGNDRQDNRLLQAMADSLRKLDDPVAVNLAVEIEQWLGGRTYYYLGEYRQAVTMYEAALSLNDSNPGLYFDRAMAHTELDEFDQALLDFKYVWALDQSKQSQIQQAVIGNSQLYQMLWNEQDRYQTIIAFVPSPTPVAPTTTPTPVPTKIPMLSQKEPLQVAIAVSPTPTSQPSATPVPPTPTSSPTRVNPTPTKTNTPFPVRTAPTPKPVTVLYVQSNSNSHVLGLISPAGEEVNTDFHRYASAPAWSPSGAEIAFFGETGISQLGGVFSQGTGLWIVDAEGANPKFLLATEHVKNLAWSPDGTKLAYEFSPPWASGEIIIVDARDGGLINHFPGEQPAWRRDGQTMAIRGCLPDCGLWLVNFDGSEQRRITFDSSDSYPSWSPFGNQLVFASERSGNWEIYLLQINRDTLQPVGDLQLLTERIGTDTTPVFSPDGREIYFRTDHYGTWRLMAIKPNGSGERLIIEGIGHSDDWGQAPSGPAMSSLIIEGIGPSDDWSQARATLQ